MLFPALRDPDDRLALRFGDVELTYAQVRDAAAHVAGEVAGSETAQTPTRPAPCTSSATWAAASRSRA